MIISLIETHHCCVIRIFNDVVLGQDAERQSVRSASSRGLGTRPLRDPMER